MYWNFLLHHLIFPMHDTTSRFTTLIYLKLTINNKTINSPLDITFVMKYNMNVSRPMSKIHLRERCSTLTWLNYSWSELVLILSCRTEEHAVMESEATSSQCWHLSHPFTSLNEKWMGALRKLVRHSLTSMFPATTVFMCLHVFVRKKTCVCVC